MQTDQNTPRSVFNLFLPKLKEQIEKFFPTPTQIQQLAIKEVLNGRNVLLIAPTGTGKTEAGCWPVFNQFLKANLNDVPKKGVSILYIRR